MCAVAGKCVRKQCVFAAQNFWRDGSSKTSRDCRSIFSRYVVNTVFTMSVEVLTYSGSGFGVQGLNDVETVC